MIETSLNERITRLLAYMLRHQPDDFDVELDRFGFGDVEEVQRALVERTGQDIEVADIESAIASGGRQRYEITSGRIRALYGHSIEIDPGEGGEPPKDLYLGLPARDQERMERFGLRGGRRRFLHLSLTEEEAKETGARTAVEYIVVKVNATDAWEQGVDFHDRKSIWLAPELPSYSLEVLGTFEDGSDPAERQRTSGRGRRDDGDSRGGRGGRERGGRGRGRGRDRDRDRDRDERPAREERPAPVAPAEAPRAEVAPVEPPKAATPAPKTPAPAPEVGGFGAGIKDEPVSKPKPKREPRSKPAPKPAAKPEPAPEPAPEPPAGGGFGAGI